MTRQQNPFQKRLNLPAQCRVHDRLLSVPDGLADSLWVLGAASAPAGTRPGTEAPLDAAARAALCASGQDRAAAPAGPRETPRRVWRSRGGPAGARDLRLAEQ